MGQGLAEWIGTARGGEQTVLQMAYFAGSQAPVVMEVGPVLAVEDVAGGKVCALASRVEPRLVDSGYRVGLARVTGWSCISN
jgi:hypothetical protein